MGQISIVGAARPAPLRAGMSLSFRYEVTGFGASPAAPMLAATASAAMKAAHAGLAFGPSRALLSQLLPAPGQGPGDKTRSTGFFRIQIHTRTPAGARYLGTIAARADPGYAATSVIFFGQDVGRCRLLLLLGYAGARAFVAGRGTDPPGPGRDVRDADPRGAGIRARMPAR